MVSKTISISFASSILLSSSLSAEVLVVDDNTPNNGSADMYSPVSSSDNTVSADGLNKPAAQIYGGIGVVTSGNTLTINDSTIRFAISGDGSSLPGSSSTNNTVYVYNSSMHSASGGDHAMIMSGNKAYIYNSTLNYAQGAEAPVLVGAQAINNFIYAEGSRIGTLAGGQGYALATGNEIIAKNTTGNWIIGGKATIADNNKITMIDSTYNNVYGGETPRSSIGITSAKNNTVELIGTSSVNNILYGGVLTVTGNSAVIDTYDHDLVTGNKLIISPTTQSIRVGGTLANFSFIEFDFSNFPSGIGELGGADPISALSVGNEARLLPGGFISNFSIKGVNQSSGRLNLIEVDPSGLPLDFGGTLASDIPGLWDYDFLSVSPGTDKNNHRLYVNFGLNWFLPVPDSHGTFTLNGSDTFTLSPLLDDRQPNANHPDPAYNNWDGKTLTKKGTGTLILTANNTYTGATNILAGTLQLGNGGTTGAVDNSSLININNDNAGGSTLAVNRSDTYSLPNLVTGSGSVSYIGSGVLGLTNADNNYSGGTTVSSGTLAITALTALGSGAVTNNSNVVFTGATGATGASGVTGDFANAISGPGNVVYTATSNVRMLSALSAGIVTVDAGSSVTLAPSSSWTTTTTNVAGNLILDTDNFHFGDVNITGSLIHGAAAATSTINGNKNNAGNIRLDADSTNGSHLVINGNYVGNNGMLWVNTQMDADNSPTDFLTVNGNVTGTTALMVRNVGGNGAKTEAKGIHVIKASSSPTDAFFLPGGHVAVGAFDYNLQRREEGGETNWYLSNRDNSDGNPPVPPVGPEIPNYTPGLGSAIANAQAANDLFSMQYEDRAGAGQNQLGGSQEDNLWVRYSGGNSKFKALDQLKTSGHASAIQLGVGLPSLLANEAFDIGVMTGYGHYKGNTKSNRTARKSQSVVEGYSIGLYGTWLGEPRSPSSLYVDTWLQWNSFDNRITSADGQTYKYDSKGITASLELGKSFNVGEVAGTAVWMQPQAQAIYQGVKAKKFKDAQNAEVKHDSDNIQLRAGVKTYVDNVMLGNMSSRPFVEVNYLHNTDPYGVKIDGLHYHTQGGRNIGEIKLGLEGEVAGSHQMWINTGYADGGKHYQDFSINAGWKYQF